MMMEHDIRSRALNLRVPTGTYAKLKAIAERFDVSINAVANATLEWANPSYPDGRSWFRDLAALQSILDELDIDEPAYMDEISQNDFDAKDSTYRQLVEAGFITNYRVLKRGKPERIFVGFTLTPKGLVTAAIVRSRSGSKQAVA